MESAGKWYRGGGAPNAGAAAYFAMNMLEKEAVGATYPGAVFITFNNSRLRVLFPDQMPIFYMYALRKGCAVKPWFLGADGPTDFGATQHVSAHQAPSRTPPAAQHGSA